MQKGLHPVYRVQVRILAAAAGAVDEVANCHGNRLHLHSCAAYFPLSLWQADRQARSKHRSRDEGQKITSFTRRRRTLFAYIKSKRNIFR